MGSGEGGEGKIEGEKNEGWLGGGVGEGWKGCVKGVRGKRGEREQKNWFLK